MTRDTHVLKKQHKGNKDIRSEMRQHELSHLLVVGDVVYITDYIFGI